MGDAPPSQQEPTFGQSALAGSVRALLLSVSTKAASLAASFMLGSLLSAEDFGAAGFVLSATTYVMVFQPWCYGDLLCATPRLYRGIAGTVQSLATTTSVLQAIMILGLGVLLSRAYPDKTWLLGLLAIAAIRPIADAICVVPMSRLKIDLNFRRMNMVEGTAAVAGSALSVLMAYSGLGAISLILPSIAGTFLRATAYWRDLGWSVHARKTRRGALHVLRRFMVLSSGSYVAGVLTFVDISILGYFSTDHALGLFVFSFGIATQLNAVIGHQLAGVIQPILGHMRGNAARQAAGLLRANHLLGSVLIPALLIQASATPVLFELAWPGRWSDAVLLHQIISIGQVFVVFNGTSHFMLKGQGRYRAYTTLNLISLVTFVSALTAAACTGNAWIAEVAMIAGLQSPVGAEIPLAVAAAGTATRAVLGPITVLAACGARHMSVTTMLDSYVRPILISLPGVTACSLLLPHLACLADDRAIQAVLALGLCGVTFSVCAALCMWSHETSRRDLSAILGKLMRSLRRPEPDSRQSR